MYGSAHYEFRPQPQRSRITYAVQWLILANVIVFAVQLVVDVFLGVPVSRHGGLIGPPGGIVIDYLAFRADLFLRGFFLWQPLTYMFLHASLLHLLMNMLFLYFCGPDVERVLSTRQFFRFYLLCGAVGVCATMVPPLLGGPISSVVGASGACMGVVVAFAMIDPHRQMFLIPFPFPIPAWAFATFFLIINLASVFDRGPVSVLTHIGGMAFGFAYMKCVPKLRRWIDDMRGRSKKSNIDAVGEAVDNILKFQDKKRKKH